MALKTRTPKTYHHGDLRNTLIETSLKLIEEKGVRALTLREIGSRAGVSRMAAYRHFANKSELLGAICEAGFNRFVDVLTAARESTDGTFHGRLSQMGLAYVRFAAGHPAHYEVMFGTGEQQIGQEHWRQSGTRAFELLVQTIQGGQASGDVAPGNPAELASVVWSTVHGISMLRLHTDLSDCSAGAHVVLLAGRILATGLREHATSQKEHTTKRSAGNRETARRKPNSADGLQFVREFLCP